MYLNLLFKLLLIWFVFTACQGAQEDDDRHAEQNALSGTLVPSQWKSSQLFPLELKYGPNFSPDEIAALENAANNWTTGVDNQIHFFSSSPSSISHLDTLSAYDDNEFGIYKLTTWPEDLPKGALAVTQLYGTRVSIGRADEHILIDHADILVNFERYTFTTDLSWGYDLHTVIIHEMGHFLGLYHEEKTTAEESIMYPTISRFGQSRNPKEKDVINILEKYNIRNIASQKELTPSQKLSEGKPVVLILELYPHGQERIRIKQGVDHEFFHIHHSH